MRQGEGEATRLAIATSGQVVGDLFALDADPARQPPHDRVVEQQRFDHALQQVDQVVMAADVGQFVRRARLRADRPACAPAAAGHQHHRSPASRPTTATSSASATQARGTSAGPCANDSRSSCNCQFAGAGVAAGALLARPRRSRARSAGRGCRHRPTRRRRSKAGAASTALRQQVAAHGTAVSRGGDGEKLRGRTFGDPAPPTRAPSTLASGNSTQASKPAQAIA